MLRRAARAAPPASTVLLACPARFPVPDGVDDLPWWPGPSNRPIVVRLALGCASACRAFLLRECLSSAWCTTQSSCSRRNHIACLGRYREAVHRRGRQVAG